MDTMTLVVAGLAAAAILVIAVGRRDVRQRLGHVRAARALRVDPEAETGEGRRARAPISDLIAQSQALAQLNKVVEQRDFGANLARDLARADLRLKPSEFLMIWGGVDRRRPADHGGPLGRPADAREPARSC